MPPTSPQEPGPELTATGMTRLGACGDADAVARSAAAVIAGAAGAAPAEIARIALPVKGGKGNQAFQALHFDFGLPIVATLPSTVVTYTAIHLVPGRESSGAATRVVPLRSLFAQREWVDERSLRNRLIRYGETHGSWLDWSGDGAHREAQLARIVDAADGDGALIAYPELERDDWMTASLGGGEFAGIEDEERFFAGRGLDLAAVEERVVLCPGETLLLDNVAVAHGRLGVRPPGEIVQITFGATAMPVSDQDAVRERLISAFGY